MAIAARNPCVVSSCSSGASIVRRTCCWLSYQKTRCFVGRKARNMRNSSLSARDSTSSSTNFASEEIRINGNGSSGNDVWWQEAFAKGTGLLQLLHEGAAVFQKSMEKNESLIKSSWRVKKFIGFDSKDWMKLLSYQVSVYALLQAAMEIAMRGEGRDRDVHVFVQRSLSHQCGPLEESIKKLLSSRDPAAADWLWSQQLPFMVTSFVNILEKDPEFSAVTSTGSAACPSKKSDIALLRLTITTCGAAMKLGQATVACTAFSSTLTDEIGRLMNMLAEFIPIVEVYTFSCNLGLRREFLSYFGSRAANNTQLELTVAERAFWVDLSEQLLKNTLVREGVLTKLRPYDTPEALERDLAVFGFFAAFGRKARAYLSDKVESQLEEPVASLLRYLEGGCVLFYPQLSTLTYYQLFTEVVCEEMEWLPAFPKPSLIEDTSRELTKAECSISVYTVLNVCSRWVADFLKYSTWIQDPAGSRVVDFLIKCQSRLIQCREELNINWDIARNCLVGDERALQQQLRLFDEDFRNMEEAIRKLESLLEQQISNNNNVDKLTAIRNDLERLCSLKQEAEALEASIKARADGTLVCSEIAHPDSEVNGNEKTYNDVFNKSIEKLRDASSDLWRGTQLLGTDVAAATILLKNGAFGQKLTEREKKTLMRTFTDLASVIPIGFLMLLPVTAVGHAAMLAAIQKYVPALIPSAYARERLDLLRQLEKVKQLEKPDEE